MCVHVEQWTLQTIGMRIVIGTWERYIESYAGKHLISATFMCIRLNFSHNWIIVFLVYGVSLSFSSRSIHGVSIEFGNSCNFLNIPSNEQLHYTFTTWTIHMFNSLNFYFHFEIMMQWIPWSDKAYVRLLKTEIVSSQQRICNVQQFSIQFDCGME